MARILLGVSGGIAAYKALELARLATQAGHGVRVLMTPAATRFVGAASFEGIVGAPVLIDEFDRDPLRGAFPGDAAPDHDPIGHLEVAANADAYLIAPASANTIAKLAAGIADSMVTTAFLACLGPAAGRAGDERPHVRRRLDPGEPGDAARARRPGDRAGHRRARLARRVRHRQASLARGSAARGRVGAAVGPGPWDGLRVLVTAGGTREPIDPVRFIGNRSSGRMGLALAERARRRGAEVTLVAANVSLPEPAGVRRIDVETTAELAAALRTEFAGAHVLLMAAAVADFSPEAASEGKIERAGSGGLELRLAETEDVLGGLAAERRDGQTLVGFAAEHGAEAIERARGKLERKGVDAIVFNDVSRAEIGFDSPSNEVTIVEAAGEHGVPLSSKEEVADAILDRVEALRSVLHSKRA